MPTRENILQEYLEFSSAEERLEWLCERTCISPLLTEEELHEELLVRDCLSKLWFHAVCSEGLLWFRCRAESKVVEGLVCFLCDLYSGKSPADVLRLLEAESQLKKIAGILTLNRQKVVQRVTLLIEEEARKLAR